MKTLVYLLVTLFLLTLTVAANASLYGDSATGSDLIDRRTFDTASYNPSSSKGGLGGLWPFSFSISWNVSQDITSDLWTYEYTLSATSKDVSHFIIEVSDGAAQDDFSQVFASGIPLSFGDEDSILEGPAFWGLNQGNSNPGYPSSSEIYGIKFNVGGLSSTYQLTTNRSPVWGNFYTNGGKDKDSGLFVHAYNSALAINSYDSDEKIDFIVRPNGTPIVPEPGSAILFLTGSAALGFSFVIKQKKN
jgi:hypothetical protein